jgi:ABC-type nickel/cobalt efflux system permease component RcnA
VLLVFGGIVLLLPGLCTEAFWGFELHRANVPLPQPVVFIFAIALAGAALILTGLVMAVLRFAPPQRSRLATAILVLASLLVGFFGLTLIFHAVVPR